MVNSSITRSRRRCRERGAAVFIVVLVITMLTAIGLFAAHAATLSTIASGNERRMTQTHYLTEYAMQLALAEIEEKGGLEMIPRSTTCSASANECWPLLPHTFGAAEPLLEPPRIAPETPGSLGRAAVQWVAKVEITDKIKPAIGNRAGSDMGGPNPVSVDYCTVTMNARLIAWPGGSAIPAAGSQESMSAVADILCSK